MTNNKIYAILHNAREYDDFDIKGFNIVYLSTDETKRNEVFERKRQKAMHPELSTALASLFEADTNEKDEFSYLYGKWYYTYKKAEYDLENESLIL